MANRVSKRLARLDKHKSATRRFPPPWTVEQIPGGFKVKGRQRPVSRLRFYGRKTRADADIASTHREQHQAWFMPICLLRRAMLA